MSSVFPMIGHGLGPGGRGSRERLVVSFTTNEQSTMKPKTKAIPLMLGGVEGKYRYSQPYI